MNVPIISDIIVEDNESFTGNLDTSAERVTLDPDETQITIDDDVGGKYKNMSSDYLEWCLNLCLFITVLRIGFIDPPYTTQEASGFVTVSVGVISAGLVLDDDFVVTLETNDIAGIQNAARGNRRMTVLYCSTECVADLCYLNFSWSRLPVPFDGTHLQQYCEQN